MSIEITQNETQTVTEVVENNKTKKKNNDVEKEYHVAYMYEKANHTGKKGNQTRFTKRLIAIVYKYILNGSDIDVKYGAAIFRQNFQQYKGIDMKSVRENLKATALIRFNNHPIVTTLNQAYKHFYGNSDCIKENISEYKSGDVQFMIRRLIHKLGVRSKDEVHVEQEQMSEQSDVISI